MLDVIVGELPSGQRERVSSSAPAAAVPRTSSGPSCVRWQGLRVRTCWLSQFGHLRRDEVTTARVQAQIDDWFKAGVKAWTVRHRINALRQVYKVLDGDTGYNPVLDIKAPPKPRAIPRAIDYGTIRTTFNQMEPSATKAFLMIVAFCGFRPEGIRRTEPWMIRFDTEPPHVIRNTAKGGDVTMVPLPDEGVLAWRMFIDHGGFDRCLEMKDRLGRPCRTRTFPNANRDWKAALVRAGFEPTRCYHLVHSYCTQLLISGGGDVALVQKARGHRDIRTTLVYNSGGRRSATERRRARGVYAESQVTTPRGGFAWHGR